MELNAFSLCNTMDMQMVFAVNCVINENLLNLKAFYVILILKMCDKLYIYVLNSAKK